MAKRWDRRDVDFLLYDVLNAEQVLAYKRFAEHSRDIFDMVLDTAERLAVDEIAPTNVDGDRIGAIFKDGKVTVPPSFHKAAKTIVDGSWHLLTEDAELGGQQLPHSVAAMAASVMSGANFALSMFNGLMLGAAHLVEAFGTPRQKDVYLKPMLAGRYGGTMCLSEPHAGSDVGALTTTAKRNADGTYSIKGTKVWISWGDQDITENIVHPVLARIEGDPAGTKGISIFLVPKYRINADGSRGELNDVQTAGIEHKLGIHGSPTCQLVFGDNDACIGELLGEERQGMPIMFKMMNSARFEVGMQGLCLAEPAYEYALQYAIDRKQGSSIREFKNPDAPRVSIVAHPDVRRMLLGMKAYVDGMRALIGFTALQMDLAHAAEGSAAEHAQNYIELLTPILKSWCTDVGFRVCEDAIQVLGGAGFVKDHPVEQYLRDMKIGSIYEGTNGIQAMDLVGRKLGLKGGQVLMQFLLNIGEDVAAAQDFDDLKAAAGLLDQLKNEIGETAMSFASSMQSGDLELPLLNAKPFLDAMGNVVVGWLLLKKAVVAATKLPQASGADATFYRNKIRTATYFLNRKLPETKATFTVIKSGERAALEYSFDGEAAAV